MYNFATFSNSFYTIILTSFQNINVSAIVRYLQMTFKFSIIIFIGFSLISKIFLQNLLISQMYNNYISTFSEDVERIQKDFPVLIVELKRGIIGKRLTSKRMQEIVKRAYLKEKLDKEFLGLHIFVEKTGLKQTVTMDQQKFTMRFMFSQLV